MCIDKDVEINLYGNTQKLNLSWADGMIGCMPIFKDKESAEKYADGLKIIAIKLGNQND